MTRLLPLLLLPFLAACAAPPQAREDAPPRGVFTSIFRPAPPEPAEPEPLPPRVIAALPEGVPPSVVQRGGDGCYLLSIEVTVPPSGYPLRDEAGVPICDAPAPAEPGLFGRPGLLGGQGRFGSPSTAAAAPVPSAAPIPSAAPVAPLPPALTPGGITPPAPLAPLNPG